MPQAVRAVRKGGSSRFRRMRCVRSHGPGALRPGFHGSDPFRLRPRAGPVRPFPASAPARVWFAPVAESRWSSSRSRPVSRPLAAGGASAALADVCRRAPIAVRLDQDARPDSPRSPSPTAFPPFVILDSACMSDRFPRNAPCDGISISLLQKYAKFGILRHVYPRMEDSLPFRYSSP